jgi:hypothetical protein
MNPRDGPDDMEKLKFFTLPGLELQRFFRSARTTVAIATLYRSSIWYHQRNEK